MRASSSGYAVQLQRVGIVGGAALHLRSLLDLQQYTDPSGEAQAAGISPAGWPLFGQLWPSARKLADLMQSWPCGRGRVLEVGCGLALASMVLHRRGANITASDRHPLVEPFLQVNLELNRLPELRYRQADWERINLKLGCYDLIIGSDVLYERDQPEALAAFIHAHAAQRAETLIIDPNRGNRTAFHRAMARNGFGLSESLIDSPLEDGSTYRGRMLHYRREAG